jgi:hypothetical protein
MNSNVMLDTEETQNVRYVMNRNTLIVITILITFFKF